MVYKAGGVETSELPSPTCLSRTCHIFSPLSSTHLTWHFTWHRQRDSPSPVHTSLCTPEHFSFKDMSMVWKIYLQCLKKPLLPSQLDRKPHCWAEVAVPGTQSVFHAWIFFSFLNFFHPFAYFLPFLTYTAGVYADEPHLWLYCCLQNKIGLHLGQIDYIIGLTMH